MHHVGWCYAWYHLSKRIPAIYLHPLCMPILGYTRGGGVFIAYPLLEGTYTTGALWDLTHRRSCGWHPEGMHPSGVSNRISPKRGQTCYLTTPSLYAYLRLYKRRGVFTACPLLPLLRGYPQGVQTPGTRSPDGVHPCCGGCVDIHSQEDKHAI